MHNYLPKIYYFIDEFNKEHIKKLNKNIAIIYRNYDQKINLSLMELILQKIFIKYLQKSTKLFAIFLMTKL